MSREIVDELHQTYCQSTGLQIRLGFDRQRAWHDFLQAGFTRSDLLAVVAFLKKGIARGDRNEGSLRFRNLIEQLDYFEEELAMARKKFRVPQPEAPSEILVREMRHEPEPTPATAEPKLIREQVDKTFQEIKRRIVRPHGSPPTSTS